LFYNAGTPDPEAALRLAVPFQLISFIIGDAKIDREWRMADRRLNIDLFLVAQHFNLRLEG